MKNIKIKNSVEMRVVAVIYLAFFYCANLTAFAQQPSYKETIAFINEKLNGKCVIEVVHGEIIAKYYNDDNKMIRKDNVKAEHLDLKRIYLDKEPKLVCLECLKRESPCVVRNLYVDRSRSSYSRTSFPSGDEASAQSLIVAFKHLIKMVVENKYNETVTFEQ
jgi:hypothetical protein